VEGAQAPWQGVWGMCSQNKTRGRFAHISNPATGGTQNPGEPKAHGGEQRGWRGRSPLPGGLGDVPPKFSKKGRAANSYHPATSGTQNAGKPSAYEGGKRGVQGAKPHGGEPWWCVPDLTP